MEESDGMKRGVGQDTNLFSSVGWEGIRLKPFVFQKLKGSKQPKPSQFSRIKIRCKYSSSSPAQDENSMLNYLGETNEVRSSIHSNMEGYFHPGRKD